MDQAKRLVRTLKGRNPDTKAHIYEGYSGRGMYGEKTTGVVVGAYEYDRQKSKFRSDNLGFDFIIY
jgi:hypothetical protein